METGMSISPARWSVRFPAGFAIVLAAALSSPDAGATNIAYAFCDPGGGGTDVEVGPLSVASGPVEASITGAYAYATDPTTLKAYASAGDANYANCVAESSVQATVVFTTPDANPGDIITITWGFLFDGSAGATATPRSNPGDAFPYGFGQGGADAYLRDGSTNVAYFGAWAEAEAYDSNVGVLEFRRYDLGYYDAVDLDNYKEASSLASGSFDTRTAFGSRENNGIDLKLVNGRTYTLDYSLFAEGGGSIGARGTADFDNTLVGIFAASTECTNCGGLQIYIGGVLYEPPAVVPVPPALWLFGSAIGLMGVVRRKAAA
jgi:hypothetical protein